MAEAKAFYSKAMGWTFNDYGPDYAGLQDPRHEYPGGRRFTSLIRGGTSSGYEPGH